MMRGLGLILHIQLRAFAVLCPKNFKVCRKRCVALCGYHALSKVICFAYVPICRRMEASTGLFYENIIAFESTP